MEMHIASIWESIATAIGHLPVWIHGDLVRTWSEFEDRSARLAAFLNEIGVSADTKVAQYQYNGPEYCEIVFAAFKLGAVPVNTNYRYLEDELVYLLENSDAEVLFFHGALGARVSRVMKRLPQIRAFVQIDDGSPATRGALQYEEVIGRHPPLAPVRRCEDGTYMLYTGGTTGMPRGVMYRIGAMTQALLQTGWSMVQADRPPTLDEIPARVRSLRAGGLARRVLCACPLMHGTGLWGGALAPLLAGSTVITLPDRSFDPDRVWQAVARERATDLVVVGDPFCKPLAEALEAARDRGQPHDISSLQVITSSGAMWSTPVKQRLLAFHDLRLLDVMGSSEGTMGSSVMSRRRHAETAHFFRAAGVKVFTEDNHEVEPGSNQVGLIALRANVPIGYYKDQRKSIETFKEIGGVLYAIPGDYARVERDGTIILLGRGSGCINSGGEKVFPEEVEEVVKLHPAVKDCVVIGLHDENFGETVNAVVSCRSTHVDSEEVILATRSHLAHFKVPKRIFFVDDVQRLPNGKADYHWARRAALDQLVPSVAAPR